MVSVCANRAVQTADKMIINESRKIWGMKYIFDKVKIEYFYVAMIKKIIKGLLIFLGVVFLLLNVIINFHAYKFTHFAADEPKLHEDKKFTTANKLNMIVFILNHLEPNQRNIDDWRKNCSA